MSRPRAKATETITPTATPTPATSPPARVPPPPKPPCYAEVTERHVEHVKAAVEVLRLFPPGYGKQSPENAFGPPLEENLPVEVGLARDATTVAAFRFLERIFSA